VSNLHSIDSRSEIETQEEPSGFVDEVMADVRQTFNSYQSPHRPSNEQFRGLYSIARVIHGMACGYYKSRTFFVSSLAAGIGKTTTIAAAVKLLLQSQPDVGVIIFLSRVEEIKNLAQAMGLAESDYSVIVSPSKRAEVGPLGNREPNCARVIFTTQQQLEKRSAFGQSFAGIEAFWYHGKPRRVRIWDETMDPGAVYGVSMHDIADMLRSVHRHSADLHGALLALFKELSQAADKSVFPMPDLERFGVDAEMMQGWFEGRETMERAVGDLFKLSGRICRVRKGRTNVVLDWKDTLPNDLGPMLVCDASGQFRETYRQWKDRGGLIRQLPSPPKRYDGLTIHWWNRGSGRNQYAHRATGGQEIADVLARTIAELPPDEPVLVVHFKPGRYIMGLAAAVRERLEAMGVERDVRFETWGRHKATNDYRDSQHVILASLLTYDPPAVEGLGRASQALNHQEDYAERDEHMMRVGEITHNLFQAACRGQIRKSEGPSCPAGSHLYIIASRRALLPKVEEWLESIFPGATVKAWQPVQNPTRAQVIELCGRQSQRKIAAETGVPRTTVQRWCRAA
jgi:hypothetical protein